MLDEAGNLQSSLKCFAKEDSKDLRRVCFECALVNCVHVQVFEFESNPFFASLQSLWENNHVNDTRCNLVDTCKYTLHQGRFSIGAEQCPLVDT